VAEITTALDEKQASAHILNVKTAEITATGASDVPLKTSADLTAASEQIVKTMFKNAPPPAPVIAAAPPKSPTQEAEEANAEQTPIPDTDNNYKTTPTRKTKNGFTLGYVFSGDVDIIQAGFAQSRPIGEAGLSFVWESNVWGGIGSNGYDYDGDGVSGYNVVGVNIPLLFQFDVSVLSLESGVQLDVLYKVADNSGWIFNTGFVVGGGLQFGFARFFYRFNYGTGYYSQMLGMRMMF
jgi:hypothetical protein